MTESEFGEAVLQHCAPLFAAAEPTLKVVFEDEVSSSAKEWLRVAIIASDRRNQAVGGGRLANTGFIAVQIFVEPNKGASRRRELVDLVREVLENKTIASPHADDELVCTYSAPAPGAPLKTGQWSQTTVTVRYRWDQI